MKNISITSFIHLIFTIAFIALIALFSLYLKLETQMFQKNQENRYLLISNSFLTKFSHHPDDSSILKLSKKLNLTPVKNRKKNLQVLNKAKVIFKKEEAFSRIRVFELDKDYYIYIQSIGYNLMYLINIEKNYKLYIAASVLILTVLLILSIYIAILKKLKPLKNLHTQIIKFSKGDLGVKLEDLSKDEIGQISQSFNEAIKNINQLINSKNLFMKNILHELKTPITKGLFLANMLETKNEEDKKTLIKTFNTMNSIINQLSNIEKLKNLHLNIKKEQIDMDKLFEQLFVILDINKQELIINKKECTVIANKELFATMLKNLIENALKYSVKKPVTVDIGKDKISVKSYGEMLQKPLEHYTQAFIQGKKNSKGFGLGLYIVQEISDLHKFKLHYSYESGQNVFTIVLK